jgi:5-methylcytosine-specific restriction endonuclease McrA
MNTICDHDPELLSVEIRRRVIKGGLVQYVKQCTGCGRTASRAYKRSEAVMINGSKNFVEFDYHLLAQTRQAQKEKEQAALEIAREEQAKNAAKRDEWWEWYSEYLKSDEWKAKAKKVHERDGNMCQGCLEKQSECVHHMTYRNVGNELLIELVALCNQCHDKTHGIKNEN